MDKKSQRAEIKRRTEHLTQDYIRMSNTVILDKLLRLPEYQSASFIFTYVSVGNEVDTHELIRSAWDLGKRIAVPRCVGKGVMELFEIHSLHDLSPGMMNIPEPKSSCPPVLLSEIDLAIIPCVSCDRRRNRLGHGGGYYDRYLAKASVPTAALCREALLLDHVCCEPHDQSVDMVITETCIY